MKPGSSAAVAVQMQQMFTDLQAGEEATRTAVARYMTKKDAANDALAQDEQRAAEMEKQAALLIHESRAIIAQAKADHAAAMHEADEIITGVGEVATNGAVEIRHIASEARAIPITSRKGKMQMVVQQ